MGRKSVRWDGALLVAAALLVSSVGAVAPAKALSLPELARLTTIEGRTDAMVKVHLPRPVRISEDPFENPLFDIRSKGSLAGVILKQDVKPDGLEILGLRVGRCRTKNCSDALTFTTVWDPSRPFSRTTELPAGDYFLYLLTDGARASVTMRLPSLDGSLKLLPDGRMDGGVGELDDLVDAQNAFLGAADHALARIGISMVGVELDVEQYVAGQIQTCLQNRSDIPGGEALHPAACFGSGSMWTYARQQPGTTRLIVVALNFTGRGDYTHGLSYRIAGSVEERDNWSFSVSYPRGQREHQMGSSVFSFDEN